VRRDGSKVVALGPSLRQQVRLSGIPYVWTSNLSDEELRQVYHHLLRARFFVGPPAVEEKRVEGAARIRFWGKECEFSYRDGVCRVVAFDRVVRVVYGTGEEWALWDRVATARDARETARERAAEERKQEKEAELVHYEQLLIRARELRRTGDLRKSEGLVLRALRLQQTNADLKRSSWSALHECLEHYSQYTTPRRGLAFLQMQGAPAWQYAALARNFERIRPDLAIPVYRTAISRFPTVGSLYTSLSLLLARTGRIADAIQVCKRAVARNLRDHTKSGFEGRIRRLEKRLSRQ